MELVVIGSIRTAWGVKGWLKLASFSGEWDHFSSLEKIDLKSPGKDRSREYRVEGFRMHQGNGTFKLVGVDTPEAGKLLSGMEIVVPKEMAAPLQTDEWYLSDLIGLQVVSKSGDGFGNIVAIVESSDDILEIERSDDSRFMVPFRTEFVGKPDMKKGRIVLNAPWLAEKL